MHRTPSDWSQTKVAAVLGGSDAQAANVLQMALDDIASLAGQVEALKTALAPFVAAYAKNYDPGVSDLDNEQPIAWHVPLGAYRSARTVA